MEFLAWSCCWILLITIALVPFALDSIIHNLNFYRRLDFFVVVGFFVLLGMGFYNYGTVKKMERKLEVFCKKRSVAEPRAQADKNQNKMKILFVCENYHPFMAARNAVQESDRRIQ